MYQVVNIYNHNVVLAADTEGKQVVLISKGVGFGRKAGDVLTSVGEDKKVFYILDENADKAKIKQLSYNLEQVGQAVEEIILIAQEQLGIHNEKLADALLDHISFAIQRLSMGLSIENPFINEITLLYSKEYDVAEQAASIIKERMNIDIGYAEKGFIALHLYSARKNKHIQNTIKGARIYQEILTMICEWFDKVVDFDSVGCKSFLLSLDRMVLRCGGNCPMQMPLKQAVKLSMTTYYQTALEIAGIIQAELDITLEEDAVAFLAVDICKFIQM